VAGGIPFASVTPAAGSLEAFALGLVPAGLTPVAFFPPTENQTMPAFSVIFQEANERQARGMIFNGNITIQLCHNVKTINFLHEFKIKLSLTLIGRWDVPNTYHYYNYNVLRFMKLWREGNLDQIIRPGKFSSKPINKLEELIHFKDTHFGGLVNATKQK